MNINATIIGQTISFLVFIVICWKFIWPHIINAMQERQKRIAEGLAAAERGAHERELAEERAKEMLKKAKTEAAEILAHAQKQGGQLVEEAKTAANIERERIIESANIEIQQEINRTKQALRAEVASVALAGAERILKKEVDVDVHKAVLDELVSQI